MAGAESPKGVAGRPRDPEQLDELLTLTTSRTWLGLAVLAALLLAAVVWSILGRIPFRAQGIGVILRFQSVVYDVVAPADGIVEEISVEPAHRVRVGDRLALLAFPTRKTERSAAQKVWREVVRQRDQQKNFVEQDLPRRKADLEHAVASLERNRAADQELLEFLERLNETQKHDLAQGYITRQQFEQTVQSIAQTKSSLRQIDDEIRSLRADHDRRVNDQREGLAKLEQEVLEAENRLRELDVALTSETVITSPVDGTVAEIAANPGARVTSGASLFLLEEDGGRLQLVGFFQNADGKKLRPGMRAQVAPSSVETNIYGTLLATVRAVSPLPASRAGVIRILGEPGLAEEMVRDGAPIQAWLDLEADESTKSGLRWSSSTGPPVEITPGTQAEASVIVREERPIDLVLPIFRTWTGFGA